MIAVIVTTRNENNIHPQLKAFINKKENDVNFYVNISQDFPDRHRGALLAKEPVLVFLDEDCVVDDSVFTVLAEKFNSNQNMDVALGFYQSPPGCSVLVKSYNKLCSAWVRSNKSKHLLGGAFAIRRKHLACLHNIDQSWGGEDGRISAAMNVLNLNKEFIHEFKVTHYSSNSLFKFFYRAWQHGLTRRNTYGGRSTCLQELVIQFKKQRITIPELLIIFLHFSIVELSSFLNIPQSSPIK